MKHTIQLSQKQGHYYSKKVDGVWQNIIKAEGFRVINRTAGVSLITPERTLDENGVETQNPIIKRDDKGSVIWVRIRKQAVGRVESGILKMIDLTLTYDVQNYYAAKLYDEFMNRGRPEWGDIVNERTADDEVSRSRVYAKARLIGGACLLYNTCSSFVADFNKEHAPDVIFADRTADTICERNLLRRWFGFDTCQRDGIVEVYSYSGEDIDFSKPILANKVESHQSDASDEDVIASREGAEEPPPDDDLITLGMVKTEIRRLGVSKAKAAAAGACKKHKTSWGDLSITEDQGLIQDVYHALVEVK